MRGKPDENALVPLRGYGGGLAVGVTELQVLSLPFGKIQMDLARCPGEDFEFRDTVPSRAVALNLLAL